MLTGQQEIYLAARTQNTVSMTTETAADSYGHGQVFFNVGQREREREITSLDPIIPIAPGKRWSKVRWSS